MDSLPIISLCLKWKPNLTWPELIKFGLAGPSLQVFILKFTSSWLVPSKRYENPLPGGKVLWKQLATKAACKSAPVTRRVKKHINLYAKRVLKGGNCTNGVMSRAPFKNLIFYFIGPSFVDFSYENSLKTIQLLH